MKLTDAELEDWALAMESGRYKYGAGSLYDEGCHCALGVLLAERGYEFQPSDRGYFYVAKDGNVLPDPTGYDVLDDLLGSDEVVKKVYRANDHTAFPATDGYRNAIACVRGLKKNG